MQYHVVFDYIFQSVLSTEENNAAIDSISTYLWDRSRDWYAKT